MTGNNENREVDWHPSKYKGTLINASRFRKTVSAFIAEHGDQTEQTDWKRISLDVCDSCSLRWTINWVEDNEASITLGGISCDIAFYKTY